MLLQKSQAVQPFNYDEAFSRNIGWLTRQEQELLRHKRVAIAGLGGVGGVHMLTLCRLGIGKFHLADFDSFDLANFNRQAGATVGTLGQAKLDVMIRQAQDINPEVEIKGFAEGVTTSNLDSFLEGVDIYVDGLDFFAFQDRMQVFSACETKGIPAITAAPLGMGTAVLNFLPGGMSFREYFRLEDGPEAEMPLRFLFGLAPSRMQMGYLAEPSAVDLSGRKGPSTIMACQLCAGVAATEALKILLGRGPIRVAPKGYHFDAYRNKLALTWRPWGNRNPLQRLYITLAKRKFGL
jgi:molybdopterin/thiamine biosynthesis adenylyltransferase